MRSLLRWAALVALALALAACDPAPTPGEPMPGIEEGTSGLVEVRVVDLDSRDPLSSAHVTYTPLLGTSTDENVDAAGLASFERSGMGVYAIEVSAPGYAGALWDGIVGGRVVVPLRARPERETFEVSVTGLGAGETAIVSVTSRPMLFQPSAVRLAGADGASVVPCVPSDPGGCDASLEAEAAGTGRLVLVAVRDEAGAARRLVRFDSVTTGSELDLGAGTSIALETVVASVPTPPIGLTAVVGVPGLSFGSAVAVLGFPTAPELALPLPVIEGMLATRWALYVATAEDAGTPDPSRRSVLVDRRADGTLGPWDAWMTPPRLVPGVAGAILLVGSPGATVHVIDWLEADGDVVRTDLLFDPDSPLGPPTSAAAARVRAIETVGDEVSLRLDDAERGATRFAEDDADLM